jgi:hypothetical protein
MTFSIMTFGIMTLSTMAFRKIDLIVTLSISAFRIIDLIVFNMMLKLQSRVWPHLQTLYWKGLPETKLIMKIGKSRPYNVF